MIKALLRATVVAVSLVLLWQLIIVAFHPPEFLLPTPIKVFMVLITQKSLLLSHACMTLLETILGLVLGMIVGLLAALCMHLFRPVRAWMLPTLLISQAIPTFALAPLLVLWVGYGMASKIIMSMIMLFFPVTSACYDGLQRVQSQWMDYAKVLGANKWRTLWRIQLPAAAPAFATGLRVAVAIAPIGAAIGEWVGSNRGLGYLMLNANARMQIDMMFAAMFLLITLALGLFLIVDRTLKRVVTW